jgi:hypothetical protein
MSEDKIGCKPPNSQLLKKTNFLLNFKPKDGGWVKSLHPRILASKIEMTIDCFSMECLVWCAIKLLPSRLNILMNHRGHRGTEVNTR